MWLRIVASKSCVQVIFISFACFFVMQRLLLLVAASGFMSVLPPVEVDVEPTTDEFCEWKEKWACLRLKFATVHVEHSIQRVPW